MFGEATIAPQDAQSTRQLQGWKVDVQLRLLSTPLFEPKGDHSLLNLLCARGNDIL